MSALFWTMFALCCLVSGVIGWIIRDFVAELREERDR